MPTVHMTPAEHHALTALLRSGLSRAAADKLGLTALMDAMSAPYRRELEERGQASHLVARGMPSILVGRYYQAEQVHPSETCMPADWFTWHRKGKEGEGLAWTGPAYHLRQMIESYGFELVDMGDSTGWRNRFECVESPHGFATLTEVWESILQAYPNIEG